MIFVDAGAFYAIYVPTDQNHERASAWLNRNSEPLVTTNFVVAETLTLLRSRRYFAHALALSKRFRDAEFTQIEWITETDYDAAWDTFETFRDKAWSFVDCLSRVVMKQLNITEAFAFDNHFRQFGSVTVVP